MGTPVVILPSGGIAVTESPNGIPLTEATNGRGFAVTFVASGGLPVTGIVSGPSIQLSASSVAENASIATVVGTLSVVGGTGTYTFTLTDSAGGKFVLGGTNNSSLRTAALLDYETASSHVIAVSATNGVTPITAKNFTITVTDVLDTVYLLTMGSGSFVLTGSNMEIIETGGSAAPFAIDGPANGVTANMTSGSGDLALPALSTTYANDIVLVAVVSNGYPILTPTSPNLTFTRHPGLTPPNNGTTGEDLFYAIASAPLVSEVITVHVTGWMYTTGLALALSGADTTTPFDTNASIPSSSGTSDALIITNASDTFCMGLMATPTDVSTGSSPAYTQLNVTANNNYCGVVYRFNTSPAVGDNWTGLGAAVCLSTAVRKAGEWTPASLPNLVAWYKADAGVYSDAGTTLATNGQKVRQWNDQSGNGYHIGNSDTNHQPVYQATSWTGSKKAVYFDPAVGNEATLQTAMGVAMGTGSAFSAFAMCQLETGSSANGRVIVYASGVNADYQGGGGILLSRNGSTQAIQTYRNGSTAGMALPAYSTDTRMGFIGSGTVTTPYINNAAGSTGADTQVFATGGKIGVGGAVTGGAASPDNNSYWKGKVAEIVLTKAALTTGERNALDAYFASRWAAAVTTVYSATPGADGAADGFSFRHEFSVSNSSMTQVRVSIKPASTGMVVSHVAIGVSSMANGGVNSLSAETTATPVELKFAGASGFSVGSGTTQVSDWTNFSGIGVGANAMVIIDCTTGGPVNCSSPSPNVYNGLWYKSAATSWNQQTPTGFAVSSNDPRAIILVETR